MKHIIIIVLILIMNIYSQLTSAGDFLLLNTSASANAVGGAYSALGDDIRVMHSNPAGLYNYKAVQVHLFRNNLFMDINQNYLGLVFPVKDFMFGGSVNILNYGDINRTTIDNPQGIGLIDYSGSALLFNLTTAYDIEKIVTLGINFKIGSIKLDDKRSNVFFLSDIGFRKRVYNQKIITSLVISSIGNNIKFYKENESLPMKTTLGICVPLFDRRIQISSEIIKPNNDVIYFTFGLTGQIKFITLMAGYKMVGATGRSPVQNNFSAGLELAYFKNIKIAYTWIPYNEYLGNVHQFDVVFRK